MNIVLSKSLKLNTQDSFSKLSVIKERKKGKRMSSMLSSSLGLIHKLFLFMPQAQVVGMQRKLYQNIRLETKLMLAAHRLSLYIAYFNETSIRIILTWLWSRRGWFFRWKMPCTAVI